MLNVVEVLKGYDLKVVKSRRHERGDLVAFFADRMKMPMPRMGYLLSVYTTDLLYSLKDRCENAGNFESCFNWHLFPK